MILLDKLSHRTGYVKKEKDLHQVIKQNKAQGFTGVNQPHDLECCINADVREAAHTFCTPSADFHVI